MKKIAVIVCMFYLAAGLFSCTKDTTNSTTSGTSTTSTTSTSFENGITLTNKGNLTLAFNHMFGAQALVLAPQSYVTMANDTIKITQLTYYVSNVTLTTASGSKVNMGNYDLIGYLAGQPSLLVLNNVPAGRYTSIAYTIGVDSLANSTGVHSGALDPSNGLYWTWNTGYVFLRLKGRFSSQNTAYSFDIGGDENVMNASHDLSAYKTGGANLTASIYVDVSKFFNSPNVYDLKMDAIDIHSSTVPSIAKLKTNISGAFNLTGIQQ